MSVNVESDVKCVCRSLFFAFPLLSLLRFTLFSFSLIHLAFNHSSFFPTFFSFLLFLSLLFPSSPLYLHSLSPFPFWSGYFPFLLSHLIGSTSFSTFPSSSSTLPPPLPPEFPYGAFTMSPEDGTKAIAFFVILFVFIFFLV